MERQLIITSANSGITLKVYNRKGTVSVVCNPTSANYTVYFTVSGKDVPLANKAWVAITDLTAKTDLQSAEAGVITMLKFVLNSGTSFTADVAWADQ